MVGRNLLDHPKIEKFDVLAPSRRELNLFDVGAVRSYLLTHRPDIVIHAAGRVGGIQANIREPVGFLLDNLDMGRNIVMAAHEAGVPRFLNIGSSCMYPRNKSEPLKEEMVLTGELEPTNEGYALAKVLIARLCKYIMHEHSGRQYKTLIPCNLYGRYDKFDPAHSHLIPAVIHKVHHAKFNGSPVEIWGDGNARREFMYSGDLADALIHCVERFDELPPIMNIGLGCDYTIKEYYAAVADVLGFTGSFSYALDKPVGMARKLVDIKRQIEFGWTSTHDLKDAVNKTYEYYLEEYAQ